MSTIKIVDSTINPKTQDWAPYHIDGPMLLKKTSKFGLPSPSTTPAMVPAWLTWKLQHVAEILHEIYFTLKGTPQFKVFSEEIIEPLNEIRYMEDVWRNFTNQLQFQIEMDNTSDLNETVILNNMLREAAALSICDLENYSGIDHEDDTDRMIEDDTYDLTDEKEYESEFDITTDEEGEPSPFVFDFSDVTDDDKDY